MLLRSTCSFGFCVWLGMMSACATYVDRSFRNPDDDAGTVPDDEAPVIFAGSTEPSNNTASDDGVGGAARFGDIIAMRFSEVTQHLWVNDRRVRIVDANGKVTTVFDDASLSGYANLGVDSAGFGYVFVDGATRVVKKLSLDGTSVDLPATVPTSCMVTALNVGADDHVYVVCSSGSGTSINNRLIDVTDGGTEVLSTSVLSVVTDFVVDGEGRFWAADPNYQQARRFDVASGAHVDLFTSGKTVFAAAIDAAGSVYLGNTKFDPTGAVTGSFQPAFSYGLAATTSRIYVPTCAYTSAWGCSIGILAQH